MARHEADNPPDAPGSSEQCNEDGATYKSFISGPDSRQKGRKKIR